MLAAKSLKNFFLISLLSVVAVINIAIGIVNYIEAEEQVEELFDAEMAQMARILQSLFTHQLDSGKPLIYHDQSLNQLLNRHDSEYSELGHKYEKKLAFQIWNQHGKLILQSATAAASALSLQQIGYHQITHNGADWRTFTLHDQETGFTVQVAQRNDVRSELTQEIGLHATLPSLLSLPLLAILIAGLVSRASTHLESISDEVQQRNETNLDPIILPSVPSEIAPIIESLNQLLYRVKQQSERERRFTSDAAHELRTPLAAIKVQLQHAQRKAGNNAANIPITKALSGVDRLSELVQQLLLLSRLDQHTAPDTTDKVSLAEIVIDIISELYPTAEQYHKPINLEDISNHVITTNYALLFTLIRNFIDNAIRYSPPGTDIDVFLDYPLLKVRDYGSGISEEHKTQVFERFFRADGDAGTNGAGLGLAICKEIARYLNITIRLNNANPGLEVTLTFN